MLKIKNKLLIALLSVSMLSTAAAGVATFTDTSIIPETLTAYAATTTWQCGGCEIAYDDTAKKFTVTAKGNGIMEDYTGIAPWHNKSSVVTSIEIKDGVKNIGGFAFYDCIKVTSISIPSSVTSIGANAFQTCSEVTTINVPSGVTSIGNNAFSNCSKLTTINIPNNITAISGGLFSNCTSLASITIPANVTSIGNNAFSNCTSLASITIPANVTSIGNSAFSGCTKLATINVPGGVTSIGNNAFQNCSALKSINVPDKVTSIGEYAFSASGLTSISIPASVTTIGDRAFTNCASLVTVNSSSTANLGSSVFSGCSKLKTCTIADGVKSIGAMAFYACALENVVIPSSVTSIGSGAFQSCSSIKSVKILGNPTIASNAFTGVGTSGSTTGPTLYYSSAYTGTSKWTSNTKSWYGGYFSKLAVPSIEVERYTVSGNPLEYSYGEDSSKKYGTLTAKYFDGSASISIENWYDQETGGSPLTGTLPAMNYNSSNGEISFNAVNQGKKVDAGTYYLEVKATCGTEVVTNRIPFVINKLAVTDSQYLTGNVYGYSASEAYNFLVVKYLKTPDENDEGVTYDSWAVDKSTTTFKEFTAEDGEKFRLVDVKALSPNVGANNTGAVYTCTYTVKNLKNYLDYNVTIKVTFYYNNGYGDSLDHLGFDTRNGNGIFLYKGATKEMLNPTWKDYTFAGWSKEIDDITKVIAPNGTNQDGSKFYDGTEFSSSKNLHAVWTHEVDGEQKVVLTQPFIIENKRANITVPEGVGITFDANTDTITLDNAFIDCSGMYYGRTTNSADHYKSGALSLYAYATSATGANTIKIALKGESYIEGLFRYDAQSANRDSAVALNANVIVMSGGGSYSVSIVSADGESEATLTTKGGYSAYFGSYGIYTASNFTIGDNVTVNAYGGRSVVNAYGIYCGTLNIGDKATVNAHAEYGATSSYGVSATNIKFIQNSAGVNNGKLTAYGATAAFNRLSSSGLDSIASHAIFAGDSESEAVLLTDNSSLLGESAAKWAKMKAVALFNDMLGGSLGAYDAEGTDTFAITSPTMNKATFIGWFTKPLGGDKVWDPTNGFIKGEDDKILMQNGVTYYAQYENVDTHLVVITVSLTIENTQNGIVVVDPTSAEKAGLTDDELATAGISIVDGKVVFNKIYLYLQEEKITLPAYESGAFAFKVSADNNVVTDIVLIGYNYAGVRNTNSTIFESSSRVRLLNYAEGQNGYGMILLEKTLARVTPVLISDGVLTNTANIKMTRGYVSDQILWDELATTNPLSIRLTPFATFDGKNGTDPVLNNSTAPTNGELLFSGWYDKAYGGSKTTENYFGGIGYTAHYKTAEGRADILDIRLDFESDTEYCVLIDGEPTYLSMAELAAYGITKGESTGEYIFSNVDMLDGVSFVKSSGIKLVGTNNIYRNVVGKYRVYSAIAGDRRITISSLDSEKVATLNIKAVLQYNANYTEYLFEAISSDEEKINITYVNMNVDLGAIYNDTSVIGTKDWCYSLTAMHSMKGIEIYDSKINIGMGMAEDEFKTAVKKYQNIYTCYTAMNAGEGTLLIYGKNSDIKIDLCNVDKEEADYALVSAQAFELREGKLAINAYNSIALNSYDITIGEGELYFDGTGDSVFSGYILGQDEETQANIYGLSWLKTSKAMLALFDTTTGKDVYVKPQSLDKYNKKIEIYYMQEVSQHLAIYTVALFDAKNGGDLTLSSEAPTWEGYTFMGWYTKPIGGNKVESDFAKNTVYYAQWKNSAGKLVFTENMELIGNAVHTSMAGSLYATELEAYGIKFAQVEGAWTLTLDNSTIMGGISSQSDFKLNIIGNVLIDYPYTVAYDIPDDTISAVYNNVTITGAENSTLTINTARDSAISVDRLYIGGNVELNVEKNAVEFPEGMLKMALGIVGVKADRMSIFDSASVKFAEGLDHSFKVNDLMVTSGRVEFYNAIVSSGYTFSSEEPNANPAIILNVAFLDSDDEVANGPFKGYYDAGYHFGSPAGNPIVITFKEVVVMSSTYQVNGGANIVYNEQYTVQGNISGTVTGTLTYEYTYYALVNETWTEISGKPTAAGDYKVEIGVAEDNPDYITLANKAYYFTIRKAEYDMSNVKFENKSVKLTDNDSTKTIVVTNLPTGADGVTVTAQVNGEVNVNRPGKYTLTATFATTSKNYVAPQNMTATLTILWVAGSCNNDEITDFVKVQSEKGIDPDWQLKIEVLPTNGAPAVVKSAEDFRKFDKVFGVYDVSLLDLNSAKRQPDGTLKLYLTIPEEILAGNFRILHVHGDEVTAMDYTIEDGYAVFETDTLSEFVFVYEQTPLTGWIVALSILSFLGLAGLGWQLYNYSMKKKGKKGFLTLAAAFPVFYVPGHLTAVATLATLFGVIVIANVLAYFFLTKKEITVKTEEEEHNEKEEALAQENVDELYRIATEVAKSWAEDKGVILKGVNDAPVQAHSHEEGATHEGLSLKESFLVSASLAGHDEIDKKFVEEYLEETFGAQVLCNHRLDHTRTGLPLADTHYVLKHVVDGVEVAKKSCFIYVYEEEGKTLLLIKAPASYMQKVAKEHNYVTKSAFPKTRDGADWWSVPVENSWKTEEVCKLLSDVKNLNEDPAYVPFDGVAVVEDPAQAEVATAQTEDWLESHRTFLMENELDVEEDENGEHVIGVFFNHRHRKLYWFKYDENVTFARGEVAQYLATEGDMRQVVVAIPRIRKDLSGTNRELKPLLKLN